MEVSLRAGEGLFHIKTAYEERYRAWPPGTLSMVDIADRSADETVGFRACAPVDRARWRAGSGPGVAAYPPWSCRSPPRQGERSGPG
jgi:hypothetical protein